MQVRSATTGTLVVMGALRVVERSAAICGDGIVQQVRNVMTPTRMVMVVVV